MGKRIFLTNLLLVFVLTLYSQDKSFTTNLPIFYINTGNQQIVDEPKIPASLEIAWNEDGTLNSTNDSRDHFKGKITIEIRGSSSQMFPKKSYGFELKDSADQDMDFPLLGMPEEEDWILYAPYTDKTLIRNVITFTLAGQIGDSYVPRCRFGELFLNGKYEGVYVLMEKIKRDKNRVAIAKLKTVDIEGEELTGGYIIKIDKTTGGGGDGWYSNFKNNNQGLQTYYQYEYPKAGEIQKQQKEYIKNYVDEFESAVYNKEFDPVSGYSSFINQRSFFDYMIMNEISKNVDGYRLSTFLYKEKNGKLNAGPIWDFNLGFGNANYYKAWETFGLQLYADLEGDHRQNPFWFKTMMNDDYFKNELRCRWDILRENQLSNLRVFEVTDSLINLLAEATDRNFERWPVLNQYVWPNYYVGETYWKEVNWMKSWLEERLRWLDFAMPGDCGKDPFNPQVEFSYHVYPNPFSSKVVLKIFSESNLTYGFQLFTVNGQKVYDLDLRVNEGENLFPINTKNLRNGIYVYRLYKGNTEVSLGKLVKTQ